MNDKESESKLPGLGSQFSEMGKSFRDMKENIPKIKVGKDKPEKNYQPDPFVEKLRRWLLIGLTSLIGGGALILVVWKLITRLF